MDDEMMRLAKLLKLIMSEDDSFKDIMKSVLEEDEKYKENIERIQHFIHEGCSFDEAFLKLSEPKEKPCSDELEEIIEAVIKTKAVMPDDELKKKIFSLWRKELPDEELKKKIFSLWGKELPRAK